MVQAKEMDNFVKALPAPFQSIKGAVKVTGLSEHFIRQGITNGTIAHIRSGNKIMVNIPALLFFLDEESRKMRGD